MGDEALQVPGESQHLSGMPYIREKNESFKQKNSGVYCLKELRIVAGQPSLNCQASAI